MEIQWPGTPLLLGLIPLCNCLHMDSSSASEVFRAILQPGIGPGGYTTYRGCEGICHLACSWLL
jgi:hypothetical protein